MDLSHLTISRAIELLEEKSITSVDLVDFYIKKVEELNSTYNVFLFMKCREELTSIANRADEERKSGSTKKLLGIPFTLKDSYNAVGTFTTAGDKYLENTLSEYNATIVQRLLDEGAILLGKVNMDSWGFGSSTENSSYGVTHNPIDIKRVAGGSSGGSAASVALDMCIFSIGEDTGGSIRNPSSYCGTFGLKPTYGRIPRFGCIAYGSSLDTIGPITKSAEDLKIIFETIQGEDGNDMTVQSINPDLDSAVKKSFAYSLDFIPESIDENVRTAYLESIKVFESKGYKAVEIKFPFLKYCIPTYYITAMSEASTNLSRYNGTRYGSFYNKQNTNGNVDKLKSWEDLYTISRSEGFGDEAKRRSVLGAYVLSEGYYDAYYKKAQKVRNLILNEINKILEDVDFILSPVTPTPAPLIGENSDDPIREYLGDIYTVTANLTGIPALAFPVKSNSTLPIGMQIMGKRFDDERLIEIVNSF